VAKAEHFAIISSYDNEILFPGAIERKRICAGTGGGPGEVGRLGEVGRAALGEQVPEERSKVDGGGGEEVAIAAVSSVKVKVFDGGATKLVLFELELLFKLIEFAFREFALNGGGAAEWKLAEIEFAETELREIELGFKVGESC